MRKGEFCQSENKDADQLCGNCTADQRLCLHCSYEGDPIMNGTFLLFHKTCLLLSFTRYTFDLSIEHILSDLLYKFGCYG